MKKAEVVLIPSPGISNLAPLTEFAKLLTRSHETLSATILLMSIPQRPLIQSYIHSLSSTQSVKFLHLPPVDPPSPDQNRPSIGFLSILEESYKAHVKQVLTSLIMAPDSDRLAGVFVDMWTTSMIDVAKELNIPCYLYFASPASFLSFMLYLPSLDARVKGEFPDFDTEFDIPGFRNPVPVRVFPNFTLKKKEGGYTWFLHHARRYRDVKGIVVNSLQELEPFCLDSVPSWDTNIPSVYPIGPSIDHDGPARWNKEHSRNHEEIMKWLDDQTPSSVVFLCFGSMGFLNVNQIREIATGLERTGYRFLWSIREPPRSKLDLPSEYTNLEEVLPEGFLERSKGKALICGWVSQVTILAHKAIGGFVSHCGWNSVLESLWYGVPIATWPIYSEQQMNAFELVKELDLAVEIRLDYREGSNLVMAEEVASGVRKLMDGESEVRRRAKEMSEKCKEALLEDGSSSNNLRCLIEELLK